MYHRRFLLVLASALFPLATWAADAAPADQVHDNLAKINGLVEKDGHFAWEDGKGASITISDFADGQPIVESGGVRISVPQSLIASEHTEAIKAIPGLAKAAKTLSNKGWTLDVSALAGPILRGDKAVAVADKVLKKIEIAATDRSKDRDKLKAATAQFSARLASVGMNDDARKATDAILLLMNQDDKDRSLDEATPEFARRIARNGWLAQILTDAKDQKVVNELKQAVLAAEKLAPVTSYVDGPSNLSEMRDAFGHGGWVLNLPNRVAYAVPHEEPQFLVGGWTRKRQHDLDLVVELPAKSDPFTDADKAISARIYKKKRLLASWDGKVFTADDKAWHEAIPDLHIRNAAADSMPPHLVLSAFNGDPRRLVVPAGSVIPAKDGTPSEVARFLGDAAKLLPDAGHVDLVGEYFYNYVYDSPDPRFPFLVGSKQLSGDIHQTSSQTVGNVAGGIMHGDCDDIAELYQAICEKQGHHGHCVLLPSHTAYVYAEKVDDAWRATLLQTGPPQQFRAKELPDALRALYTSFDQTATFDPDGLGVLLRFSGENTRGPWRLSWRIFADPEYSKTMVEVQRDWQYQTYERGISTMKKMIDSGDKDPANYRELAGLATFTGQYALAVEYNQKAIDVTADPVGKLQMNLEQVGHLHDAGKDDEARTLALDILDIQIPANREKLGEGLAQISCSLAQEFNKLKAWDLATRTLKETIEAPMERAIMTLAAIAVSPQYNEKVWAQLDQAQNLIAAYCAVSLELITGTGPEAAAKDPVQSQLQKAVEMWANHIAFRDADDVGNLLTRYAMVGAILKFRLGPDELLKRLDASSFPESSKKDHFKRAEFPDDQQVASDLQWVKACVPFWFGLLAQELGRDKEQIDVKLAKRFGKSLLEAAAAQKKLGLSNARIDQSAHLGTVIVALLEQDAKTLRERLKFVAKENDKRLRDDTAQWLGDTARCLDAKWYDQVIQIWKEEVNYKPKWFWVAWRAALNKAPQMALAVAKRAAAEFKDDPSFTEEYEFMRQILEPALKAGSGKSLP